MNKKKFDQKKLDDALETIMVNLIQISKENEYIFPLPLDHERIKYEIMNMLVLLFQFPKSKSYSIDEIKLILQDDKYIILKSTNVILAEVFNVLNKFNLLPGIYISEIGVLDLVSDLKARQLSKSQVDQLACGGISSIEKPSIFLNYVYKHNQCPFCKEAVKLEKIVVFYTDSDLKAGITYITINKNENASFHSNI